LECSTDDAKNDWKRHESSQHYQDELWKCLEPALPGERRPFDECGIVFFRENLMAQHLTTAHGIDAHAGSSKLVAYHVGPNHQYGFWCGFCRKVVRLNTPMGVEAYDERFSHIDVHLVRERRAIEGWVDVRACATKLEMRIKREREDHDAAEQAAAALGELAGEAAARAGRERARARGGAGPARAAEARPLAMAGLREAEERRVSVNQEEYGDTIWTCVSVLSKGLGPVGGADGGAVRVREHEHHRHE